MCLSGFNANAELARHMIDRRQQEDNEEMSILCAFIMLHLVGSEGLAMRGRSARSPGPRKNSTENMEGQSSLR
jgi:hypothetical protein